MLCPDRGEPAHGCHGRAATGADLCLPAALPLLPDRPALSTTRAPPVPPGLLLVPPLRGEVPHGRGGAVDPARDGNRTDGVSLPPRHGQARGESCRTPVLQTGHERTFEPPLLHGPR